MTQTLLFMGRLAMAPADKGNYLDWMNRRNQNAAVPPRRFFLPIGQEFASAN